MNKIHVLRTKIRVLSVFESVKDETPLVFGILGNSHPCISQTAAGSAAAIAPYTAPDEAARKAELLSRGAISL